MGGRTITVTTLGAAAGALLGVLGLALMGGLVVTGTVDATLISQSRSIARPQFTASAGAMYLLVVIYGAAAGLLLATGTVAIMRFLYPEERRFGPGVLELGGTVVGAVFAYVGLRTGLGWGGAIIFDEVTGTTTAVLSVFRATLVAAGVGAFVGVVIAPTVEWLSRPAVVGLEGEAWPESRPAFLKETMRAMAVPVVALATAAVIIFGFSRVLIAGAEDIAIVVTVFSVVAALVLAGAAYIAAHPPRGSEPPDAER